VIAHRNSPPKQQALAVQMARGGTAVTEIARHFGCARQTVYKALGQMRVGVE